MGRLQGDGPEHHKGHAIRWDADHVYVELVDARLGGNGAWLTPADVYRGAGEDGVIEAASGVGAGDEPVRVSVVCGHVAELLHNHR